MASTGFRPLLPRTDNENHFIHYYFRNRTSALDKSKLHWCIFFHCILFFVLLSRLIYSLIDGEQVKEVPEPYLWEHIWLSSLSLSVFCMDAINRNNLISLHCYMVGTVILGYLPIMYAFFYWLPEVWIYLFSDDYFDKIDLVYFERLPYGMLTYGFILLALLVHSSTMYYSLKLKSAWELRRRRRAD